MDYLTIFQCPYYSGSNVSRRVCHRGKTLSDIAVAKIISDCLFFIRTQSVAYAYLNPLAVILQLEMIKQQNTIPNNRGSNFYSKQFIERL